jgi:hypothetical protein
MSEIKIVISPDGTTKLDVEGMQGQACANATQHLELVLGGQGKRSEKPEFYAPELIDGTDVVRRL